MNGLILSLAFINGFCVMALELLGGRILAPFFGNGVYVWGSIITVFMLALSIGYLLGGKWSMKNPSLRRLAALFSVSSMLLVSIVYSYDLVGDTVFSQHIDPRYGAMVAALLLFLPVSIIMGMVSPYCVRLSVKCAESSGNNAGVLFFVSTLGSALGTIITSFYLIALLEIDQILYGIAIMMLAAAIMAFTTQKEITSELAPAN